MDTGKLKKLLNNLTLLKWVGKFSADNMLEDNKMAKEKFSIKASEDSVSVLDPTATKLLITEAEFSGEEFVRFNLKQLNELIAVGGNDGELIIPKVSKMREMIAQVKGNVVVICPLPPKEAKKKEE